MPQRMQRVKFMRRIKFVDAVPASRHADQIAHDGVDQPERGLPERAHWSVPLDSERRCIDVERAKRAFRAVAADALAHQRLALAKSLHPRLGRATAVLAHLQEAQVLALCAARLDVDAASWILDHDFAAPRFSRGVALMMRWRERRHRSAGEWAAVAEHAEIGLVLRMQRNKAQRLPAWHGLHEVGVRLLQLRSKSKLGALPGDRLLGCAGCGHHFLFTAEEQRLCAADDAVPPRRCYACRQRRKQRRHR